MIASLVAAALWALAAGIALSLIVGAVVAGLIRLLRPAAATRHALWSVALAVAGLAPVAILAAMLIRGELGGGIQPPALPAAAPAHARAVASLSQRASAAAPAVGVPSPGAAPRSLPELGPDAARDIVAVWLAGVIIGLGGLARSLARVRGLKRRSRPLDGNLATELPWLTTTAGREIYLRLSYETETPIAVGFRRPVVLLPTEMATAEGLTSIEPLVMHEYAHLTRYDDWTNLAQRTIERLFWFNPLVWVLGRHIALEREVAADEAVVARTHDAKRYASALWRMAQEMRMPEHVVVAPGAMLTRKQISVRIERLLDDGPAVRRGLGAAAFAVAVLAASGVAALAAGAPPVVLAQASPSAPEGVTEAVPPAPGHVLHSAPVAHTPPTQAAPHIPWTPHLLQMPHIPAIASTQLHDAQRQVHDMQRQVADAAGAIGHVRVDLTEPLTREKMRDCIGCDFSHRDLHGLDLSNMSFIGNAFTGARLNGVNLAGSHFKGVSLKDADLTGADLRGAQLTGVDLNGAILTGADLHGIQLIGTSMGRPGAVTGTGALRSLIDDCVACDLSNLDLHGQDLHGIKLNGADLHGADLRGANLRNARLNAIDLSRADLTGADLSGATLDGVDLHGASLAGAITTGIHLLGTDLP